MYKWDCPRGELDKRRRERKREPSKKKKGRRFPQRRKSPKKGGREPSPANLGSAGNEQGKKGRGKLKKKGPKVTYKDPAEPLTQQRGEGGDQAEGKTRGVREEGGVLDGEKARIQGYGSLNSETTLKKTLKVIGSKKGREKGKTILNRRSIIRFGKKTSFYNFGA